MRMAEYSLIVEELERLTANSPPLEGDELRRMAQQASTNVQMGTLTDREIDIVIDLFIAVDY